MIARLTRGISLPLQGFSYLSEKKLWGYTVFPLILTAVIVAVLAIVLWATVVNYLVSIMDLDLRNAPVFIQWLFSLFKFIMIIVLLYLAFTVLMRLFVSLFGIIVIPFLSPLVEKILAKEGLATIAIKNSEWVGYVFSAIAYSIKMLLWQTAVAILLIFTGPLQPFLNFGFSSYFLGRSYLDYVLELLNHPAEFDKLVKGMRTEATGIGIFSSGFVFIPFVGPVFAPVLSVVAATRLFVEKNRGRA